MMRSREHERPVRSKADGVVHDTAEEHPAYAMIAASRVSSHPGATLFGSDFRHQHYITITIRKASLRRGLSNDWYSADNELIEVALSEAQWATFLSTLNMGNGVPCTLQWLPGVGYVTGIEPDTDRQKQSRTEIEKHIEEGIAAIDAVLASGKLTKANKDLLEQAKRQVTGHVAWVTQQFDEHAEKTVERAKIEVEAYLNSAVQRAGLTALQGGTPLLELAEPEGGPE